jgi:hypothetical protein
MSAQAPKDFAHGAECALQAKRHNSPLELPELETKASSQLAEVSFADHDKEDLSRT